MYAIDFPLPQKFIWQSISAIFCNEAVSAFRISYGNDLQIPSVFGKWRLYIVLRGYLGIFNLSGWYGA